MWIRLLSGCVTALPFCAALLLVLPLPAPQTAPAQGGEPLSPSFGPEDARAAVQADDRAALTAGLELAQSEFLAGQGGAEDIRAIYAALSRSDPEVVAFVESWAAAEPENPHALISRAWSIHNAAQQMCCDNGAQSARVEAAMREDAGSLALRAYRIAPYLLPASDAMLRKITPGPDAPTPFEVLDDVLRQTPNLGSIERGIDVLRGKSVDDVNKVCTALSEDFDDPARAARFCVIHAALRNGPEDLREQLARDLWDMTWDPETKLERVELYLRSEKFLSAKQGHRIWLSSVLNKHDADPAELVYMNRLARIYETRLQASHDIKEYPHRDFLLAHADRAERFLKDDPYNIGLIDIVQEARDAAQFTFAENEDGQLSLKRREDLDQTQIKADGLALARARLRASPYASRAWSDYAQKVSLFDDPASVLDGDAAMENAIAYADDPRPLLLKVMQRKAIEYNRRAVYGDPASESFLDTPAWRAFFQSTDPSWDFRCPFLRAELMFKVICSEDASAICQSDMAEHQSHIATIRSDARADPACAGLMTATPQELWYQPVDLETALNVDQASASSSSSP